MRFRIIAVGTLGRGPEADLYDLYAKRLSRRLDLREIDDGPPDRVAAAMLAAVPADGVLVALDETGPSLTSRALAAWVADRAVAGQSPACFAIGGADGLVPLVRQRAALVLSFGAMTWPHRLVRAMLAEQLYRCATIADGHPYHRD